MNAGRNHKQRWSRAVASAATVVVVLTGLVVAAPAGAIVPASRIVELLNAQRAANGIPGDITEVSDWSSACAKHNLYMTKTGQFGHTEDQASPWYTPEGAFAGANSVIAQGAPQGPNWETGNPFETAPIHLAQLLSPRLFQMGADDDGTHICATTFPGYRSQSSAPPAVYTYPGDGVVNFATEERAVESPWVPGDFVGLPSASTTGPYLFAFLFGSANSTAPVTEATLTGPKGPVAVRTVDQTAQAQINGTQVALHDYLPGPMAFIIPAQPLSAGLYHAHVAFSDGGTPVVHDWSFTAGIAASGTAGPLDFGKGKVKGARVVFELDAEPSLVGAKARITITRSDARVANRRAITLRAKQFIRTPKPAKGERVRVKAVVQSPHVVARARFLGH
jgi:hypothetical protein